MLALGDMALYLRKNRSHIGHLAPPPFSFSCFSRSFLPLQVSSNQLCYLMRFFCSPYMYRIVMEETYALDSLEVGIKLHLFQKCNFYLWQSYWCSFTECYHPDKRSLWRLSEAMVQWLGVRTSELQQFSVIRNKCFRASFFLIAKWVSHRTYPIGLLGISNAILHRKFLVH